MLYRNGTELPAPPPAPGWTRREPDILTEHAALWQTKGRMVTRMVPVRNTRRFLWWTIPWFGHHLEEREVIEWDTPTALPESQ